MADKGSKDKGKKEQQKKAKLNPKEKRKLKKEKKNKYINAPNPADRARRRPRPRGFSPESGFLALAFVRQVSALQLSSRPLGGGAYICGNQPTDITFKNGGLQWQHKRLTMSGTFLMKTGGVI